MRVGKQGAAEHTTGVVGHMSLINDFCSLASPLTFRTIIIIQRPRSRLERESIQEDPSQGAPSGSILVAASGEIPFNLSSLWNKLVLLATWLHFVHNGFLFVQIFNLPLPVPGPNV